MVSKKAVLVYILEILRAETDEKHTLSQEEIRSILRERYEIIVDRKTLGRHLNDLYESGEFNIMCEESAISTDGIVRRTNFYIIHPFEESELHLIIDGLLASRHIESNQRQDLIERVSALGGRYFKGKGMEYVESSEAYLQRNQELFLNIDLIQEAINKNKKISLVYYQPDIDKKLHVNVDADGKDRTYIFNPYHLVANRGQYYVVGNHDKHDDMATLRVDRIGRVKVRKDDRKPLREIKGYKHQRFFNVHEYMKEHIYMFGGDSVTVHFQAKRSIVNQILDWFDGNVEFLNATDETVDCRVQVNRYAFKYWALQYVESVKVLSPSSLVFEVREAIRDGLAQYEDYTPYPMQALAEYNTDKE